MSIFPPEYYKVCGDNSRKRYGRWFCNRPLSPVSPSPTPTERKITNKEIVQISFVSSSDESLSNTVSGQSLLPAEVTFKEVEPNQDSEEEGEQLNSDVDPEYVPSSSTSTEGELSDNNSENYLSFDSSAKKSLFDNGCTSKDTSTPSIKHIIRNHAAETETQQILAAPIGSKKRKELLTELRKKGNYLSNCEEGKPMRKHEDTKYLPCPDCLGFYSSRNLWKHRKTCTKDIVTSSKAQVDAQNFLVRNLKIDPRLREVVFPRMRADAVSLVAKKDPIICAFAARYIKIHREKHFVNVASRKMRELAKILIELRKMQTSIKTLFSAFKPEYFDLLVTATKKVARYDYSKEYYKAPTFALNMGTSLKQCCDLALLHVLKRKDVSYTINAADTESEIKTLIQLIESHWRFDISGQASHDLSIKKWNKITLVPLASDLKLLKDYLVKIASKSVAALEKNNADQTAYTKLLETIFCRVILLNRKRPGELQRFPLHTYETSLCQENSTYEEFSEAVSKTERELMKIFKRIVISGKRGRGVPVLFSRDVQDHLTIILKYRNGIVKKPNPYLFCNPNSGQPIVGYKVLHKYAFTCGAKNPSAITCTRLRKHLATLSQLFNMTENDIEQLASFMGHTLGIHRSSYRLPDDVYQTAKISKLLILMEKGEAGQFKGKSLDEINIDLEEDLITLQEDTLEEKKREVDCNNGDTEENEIQQQISHASTSKQASNASCNTKQVCNKSRKRVLVPWTKEQKDVVSTFFKEHIKAKKPPKRAECEELEQLHPQLLSNKNWLKIKVFV